MAKSKQRTPTQLKRHYKRVKNTCFAGEFLSVAAPFVTIGIVNYDKYFVEYNGTKMSIACIMAMALMGLAVWLVSKKKFSNSFITLIVGWAMVTCIFYLLGSIINDIATIMLFGLIGILGAYGLDIASAKADAKAKEVETAIKRAEQDNMVDAYKQEKKEKKVNKGSILG